MKGLAPERPDLRAELLREFLNFGQKTRSVGEIADKRVTDMGHVDADLVRSPGFKAAFQKTGNRTITECGFCTIMCSRAASSAFNDGLALPALRIAIKRGVDCSFRWGRSAPDQGLVGPHQRTI